MAEPVSIIAGVGSILKTLTSTGIYLKGIGSASREAQEVAKQVHATEAILKSLQASLKVLHRSHEFVTAWGESSELVIGDMKTTIEKLNMRLGAQGGKARLNLWGKVKWPLEREESLQLQQHMQAYMQMLSMVQNAFLQGNMQTVRESAQGIEDIFTEVATLPSSQVSHSTVLSDSSSVRFSDATIVPNDSISQLGAKTPPKHSPRDSQIRFPLADYLQQFHTRDKDPTAPRKRSEVAFKVTSFFSENFTSGFMEVERRDHGSGEVVLALANDNSCVWIMFRFGTSATEELRWCTCKDTDFNPILRKMMFLDKVSSGQQVVLGEEGRCGFGQLSISLQEVRKVRGLWTYKPEDFATTYKKYKDVVDREHVRRRNLAHARQQRGLV